MSLVSEIPDTSSTWKNETIKKKTVTRLKPRNNRVTCDQFEILQEQKTFLKLFTSRKIPRIVCLNLIYLI